jgi:hypothetical protein
MFYRNEDARVAEVAGFTVQMVELKKRGLKL